MAVRLAIAVLALAVAVPVASAQKTTPRATILQQAELLKQAKWRAMYATYTQKFRQNCPYAKFVQNGRETRRALGPSFQLRGIQVRMETPRRAIVAYRFVKDGRTVAAVTFRHRDVYVKVGSRWHDELDNISAC